MIEEYYTINPQQVVRKLREAGAHTVLLEAPDGLKHFMARLSQAVKRTCGCRVYVRASHTYGGCDLGIREARLLGADHIIHIGHTPYPNELATRPELGDLKVIFIYAHSKHEIPPNLVSDAVELARSRGLERIGLLATIQHVNILERVELMLEKNGLEVVVGKPFFKEELPGQVLGCEYSAARSVARSVDGYMIISGGMFHAIGAFLATRKPVIKIDPYEGRAIDISSEASRILQARYAKIVASMDARNWGVIIGSKSGQYRPAMILVLEELLERNNMQYVEFITDELNKEILDNIDTPWIDAYIITSCPRIAIDDLGDYHKPVLTPGEARMALTGNIEEYMFPW